MPVTDLGPTTGGLSFGPQAARALFPLHLVLDASGTITSAGATTDRVFKQHLVGQHFFDVFTITRPHFAKTFEKLRRKTGSKLHMLATPDDGEPVEFRGLAAPFGPDDRGLLIDLSFGPGISDAITRFDLTRHDFRSDDYAIDIVYTFETQRSLLEDSKRLTAALQIARDEAEERANRDPVTGIANRRALQAKLTQLLCDDDKSRFHALLHLDLDKFKPINDTFGHNTGDEVLLRVSQILAKAGGPDAIAARIGGDEFVLCLPDIASRAALDDLVAQLLSEIAAPLQVNSRRFCVGVSIGAVEFSSADYANPEQLLQHSDIALYEAKKTGNTAAHLNASMLQRRQANADLVHAIEAGIAEGQFIPFFQLQIDAISNRVHGAEILARWDRPDGTIATPAMFLEAASHAGLMGAIDDMVRSRAVETLAAWRRMDLPFGGISLNLSPENLRSHDFCETFQDEVFAAGLSPQSVRLELLESILFEQSDTYLVRQSHRLHDAGFPLVLDDFGTGHASIASLVDIPVSMIKIDRSFVQGIDYISKKRRIVTSVLAMSDSLGIRVMAEGVETRAELAVLKNAGCRYYQGFHFARPLPAAEAAQLIRTWGQQQAQERSAG